MYYVPLILNAYLRDDPKSPHFIAYFEKLATGQFKHLGSDISAEYGSNALNEYHKQREILYRKAKPYKLQQNAIVEKALRVWTDNARSMI